MKIIISSKPGVGKTTLVKELISKLKVTICGFYTEEIRENGKRVGFKVVNLENKEEVVLAHVYLEGPKKVGKYKVNIKDFEPMAINILEKAIKGKEELIIIDEIGKMELFSKVFRQLVIRLLNSPKNVIFTIKTDWVKNWIPKIRDKDIYNFDMSRQNYTETLEEIQEVLSDSIQ
ncbi:MAG: NTPase [Candidatus Omnitrophota bacterium]